MHLWSQSYPKEYIPEFPFVNRSLCFMPHHHLKSSGEYNCICCKLREVWRGEKNTFFIHGYACVLQEGGCGLGNHSSFLEIRRQCTYNRNREASKWLFTNPPEKKWLLAATKGKIPVASYKRWTNKLNLHFRCALMCENWNMGDVKRDFSEWPVESVSLLGSPIHIKFLND